MILEKNSKSEKTGKSGHYRIGLLRRNVGNPRRGVDLRHGVGYPRCGKAEVPKLHPLSTPQCSYCSQRASFEFLFPNTSYMYTDSLKTLIND